MTDTPEPNVIDTVDPFLAYRRRLLAQGERATVDAIGHIIAVGERQARHINDLERRLAVLERWVAEQRETKGGGAS